MNKPFLLLFSLLFCWQLADAQVNLVPNPSFEQYDTCPNDYAQVRYAKYWTSPTNATPDYLNTCASMVPNNAFGYENAHTGSAYCGLIVWGNGLEWKEYLQTKLINTLEKDSIYDIVLYFSLADSCGRGFNNLGIYFSENSFFYTITTHLPFIPQINDTSVITTQSGWVKKWYKYKAVGNENYITIGNFFSESDSKFIWVKSYDRDLPYYYIDDLSITKRDSIETQSADNATIPTAFSPNGDGENDTLYVKGSNIKEMTLLIYDRWGELVFESHDLVKGWDGRFKDIALDSGIFAYYLEVTFTSNGKSKPKQGNISLIR